jgi:diguanylate cyclase (GGDEF)-like protein
MGEDARKGKDAEHAAPTGGPDGAADHRDWLSVLLVDNDLESLDRSEEALRRRLAGRVVVRRATTLADAIAQVSHEPPDALVLEPAIDTMDEVATLASLRAVAPPVPVVVYAGRLTDPLALRLMRAGAQECLAKASVPPAALARTLGFAIERQRRLASLEAERSHAAHRATHDVLTGLPNRALFFDHLERALLSGSRHGTKTGVLYLDLDGFKDVNDRMGHAAGDAVLRAVAGRLLESVRRSDLVARLGGDEFVVLLPDVASRLDVARVRAAIVDGLDAPIAVDEVTAVPIRASVGEAMAPLDGTSAPDLLEQADGRMYRAKGAARRTLAHAQGAGTWEAALLEAVPRGEITVHYQPIIDVASGRMGAMEALVRWEHPEHGLLPPDSFLQLAEDTGLVVPIGAEVLRQACRTVVALRREPALADLVVTVNMSGVELREPSCARVVAAVLADTGCPAEALTVEVTETNALVEGTPALASMAALQARGVRLLLDDFGVGYGSLHVLRDAPVAGFKLDRRFVRSMLEDSRDWAIVTALLKLARGLPADVVAEGVETPDQSRALARLGCRRQQGYLFARPLPEAALRGWALPEAA